MAPRIHGLHDASGRSAAVARQLISAMRASGAAARGPFIPLDRAAVVSSRDASRVYASRRGTGGSAGAQKGTSEQSLQSPARLMPRAPHRAKRWGARFLLEGYGCLAPRLSGGVFVLRAANASSLNDSHTDAAITGSRPNVRTRPSPPRSPRGCRRTQASAVARSWARPGRHGLPAAHPA